jgi:quercetin dioxygenase-like cupin family protein
MITRRELAIACLASMTTLAVAWAQTKDQPKQIIKSAVFDVENLPSKAGKVGSQKSLFNGKTAMLDSFECHTSTVNAGQEVHGPQPQFEEELIIVREGTVQTVVDGKTVRVSPGSVIFAASNDPHGVKNVGETPATYYVIKWTAGGATAGK